jgi:hypothetical protein
MSSLDWQTQSPGSKLQILLDPQGMREMNFSWAAREFFMRENREYVKIFKPFHCKQGVCHTVALPFTLKSILRQN